MTLDQTVTSVDWDALLPWLDDHGVGSGPITDAVLLSGGSQNILFRFNRAGASYVLRRPAPSAGPRADNTMRREAALLTALRDTDVPHARLVAAGETEKVLGRTFYITLAVDGFNPRLEVPAALETDPSAQHRLGLAAVDALATLSRLDPDRAPLSRAGGEAGNRGQLDKLRSVFASYTEVDGWLPGDLDSLRDLADCLERHAPEMTDVRVTHGDFHLGNLIFDPDTYEVAAIIDWELARLGDPLLDLGQLLSSWPDPDEPRFDGTARPLPGLPSHAELTARFEDRSGRSIEHAAWYQAFACYRLAVILEGTHARAIRGAADPEVGTRMHAKSQAFLERGTAITALWT